VIIDIGDGKNEIGKSYKKKNHIPSRGGDEENRREVWLSRVLGKNSLNLGAWPNSGGNRASLPAAQGAPFEGQEARGTGVPITKSV